MSVSFAWAGDDGDYLSPDCNSSHFLVSISLVVIPFENFFPTDSLPKLLGKNVPIALHTPVFHASQSNSEGCVFASLPQTSATFLHDTSIFFSDEKRVKETAVEHDEKLLDGEKARIICWGQGTEWSELVLPISKIFLNLLDDIKPILDLGIFYSSLTLSVCLPLLPQQLIFDLLGFQLNLHMQLELIILRFNFCDEKGRGSQKDVFQPSRPFQVFTLEAVWLIFSREDTFDKRVFEEDFDGEQSHEGASSLACAWTTDYHQVMVFSHYSFLLFRQSEVYFLEVGNSIQKSDQGQPILEVKEVRLRPALPVSRLASH